MLARAITGTIFPLEISSHGGALRCFTKLLALFSLGLIFVGALVTSHDAGLAVPDWPTTWGSNMFLYPPSRWVGNILFEHGHRLFASAVGLGTLLLAFWLWRVEKRAWVKLLGFLALAAVLTQGVLGGLTVLYLLPTPISVAHAVLGQTFFLLLIAIAYTQSKEFEERLAANIGTDNQSGILRISIYFLLLLYMQLVIGATMRHTGSGLAIPDFPTMGGKFWPAWDSSMLASINELRLRSSLPAVELWQVLIHFLHRLTAVLVTLGAALLLFRVLRCADADKLRNLACTIFLLVLGQFLLGVITVWGGRPPYIASLHVMVGAALLGSTFVLILRCLPLKWIS